MFKLISRRWRQFWVRLAGPGFHGRWAARLAAWGTGPYHARAFLARMHRRGFVAPSAALAPNTIEKGANVYLGDRVVFFQTKGGGKVHLDDRVCLYGDTFIQTGAGASLKIGTDTHVQPGCYFAAFISDITIGRQVEIAPTCAFYSYDHSMKIGEPIQRQPLKSRGGITIGDGVWLGHGVTVLQGVEIGSGAVIAAHSVVTRSVPENAIAAGAPAQVLKYRT